MQNKPNDVRRDLYNLRNLVERGEYCEDERGDPIFRMQTGTRHAKEIEARLPADGPINTIVIETPTGRYQLEIGDTLVIRVAEARNSVVIRPLSNDAVELVTRVKPV
jgi:hypothetical protein